MIRYEKKSFIFSLIALTSYQVQSMENPSYAEGDQENDTPSLIDIVKVAELSYKCRKTIEKDLVNQDIEEMKLDGYRCLAYEAPKIEQDISGLYSLAVFNPKRRICILGFRGTEENNISNLMTDLAIVHGNADGQDPYYYGIEHVKKWRQQYFINHPEQAGWGYTLVYKPVATAARFLGGYSASYWDVLGIKDEESNKSFLEKMLINVAEFYSQTLLNLVKILQQKNYTKKRETLLYEAQKEHDGLFNVERGKISAEFCYNKLRQGLVGSSLFEEALQYKIYFTGHSLGGAIAQVSGVALGYPAVTVNGVGTQSIYTKIFGKLPTSFHILNLMRVNDLVATFGTQIGDTYPYPDYKIATSATEFIWANHSIENFRKDLEEGMSPLERSHPEVPVFIPKRISSSPFVSGNRRSLRSSGDDLKQSVILSEEYLKEAALFQEKAKSPDISASEKKAYMRAAMDFYEKAAEEGNSDAQYKLGSLYLLETQVSSSDESSAFYWIRRAAQQQDPIAQCHLGILLHSSSETKNQLEADEWFLKGKIGCRKLAESGDPMALFCFGVMSLKGLSILADKEKGILYLKKSRAQGCSHAHLILSELGLREEDHQEIKKTSSEIKGGIKLIGFPSDPLERRKSISSLKPISKPESLSNFREADSHRKRLLDSRLSLEEKEKSRRLILEFYEIKEKQGDPKACYDLSDFYAYGLGLVSPDLPKSFLLMEKAAQQGGPRAQCRLGLKYLFGEGVEQNTQKALEWCAKGKKGCQELTLKKDPEAIYCLAQMLVEGLIESPGEKEKIELREKGIRLLYHNKTQGEHKSILYLGSLYEQGNFMERNPKKAYGAYKEAASLGNEVAKAALQKYSFSGWEVPEF